MAQPVIALDMPDREPMIMMGDGGTFHFELPDASAMTIEDYAWGLAGTNRFRCQTRYRYTAGPDPIGPRCLYSVAQHVVLLAEQMLLDGESHAAAWEGLMHESDEVVWGDFPTPAKPLLPADLKAIIDRAGAEIDRRFGVTDEHGYTVKLYDLRMLATENRELRPHVTQPLGLPAGIEPFAFRIACWEPEFAVKRFLDLHEVLKPVEAT